MNLVAQCVGDMGNISSMIGRGARVYLRHKNPHAKFLEDLGVTFSYIDANSADLVMDEPLTDTEKEKNKDIMLGYWARAQVEDRTRALFNAVAEEVEHRRIG